jgi:hypothetical protein
VSSTFTQNKRVQITVTCPDWLGQIIEEKAKETTRSRSAYIVHILKEAHTLRQAPRPQPLSLVSARQSRRRS